MSKCINCGSELKQIKGKVKFAVQLKKDEDKMKTIKEIIDNASNCPTSKRTCIKRAIELTKEDVLKLIDEDIGATKSLDDDIEWKYNVLIVLEALKARIQGK